MKKLIITGRKWTEMKLDLTDRQVEVIRQALRTQEEHHKRHSYQEEFRELCQKHELEIDERYVWD